MGCGVCERAAGSCAGAVEGEVVPPGGLELVLLEVAVDPVGAPDVPVGLELVLAPSDVPVAGARVPPGDAAWAKAVEVEEASASARSQAVGNLTGAPGAAAWSDDRGAGRG